MSPKKLTNDPTWEAIAAKYDVVTVQKAIEQYYRSKEYHKKHNLKQKLILAKAKEAGITAE